MHYFMAPGPDYEQCQGSDAASSVLLAVQGIPRHTRWE